jgi:hypothetical protein
MKVDGVLVLDEILLDLAVARRTVRVPRAPRGGPSLRSSVGSSRRSGCEGTIHPSPTTESSHYRCPTVLNFTFSETHLQNLEYSRIMGEKTLHPLPTRDPVGGGPLYVSELTAEDTGVVIRGKFKIPKLAQLDSDQANFLEIFLRTRGNLTAMEKEVGLSYPTLRSRLDALLDTLDLKPISTEPSKKEVKKVTEQRRSILEMLERGEITAAEAKARMKEVGA